MTDAIDFQVRCGNTGTIENPNGLVFAFCYEDEDGTEVIEDLNGVDFYFFTAAHNGEKLTSNSTDVENQIQVDIPTATVTIPVSLAWSRFVECPGTLSYELEFRTVTSQRSRVQGTLHFIKGPNDD